MVWGLTAGILWGLDTVILGAALAMAPFFDAGQAALLAPFVSTFLHDLFSSVWMLLYLGLRRQLGQTRKALHSRSGRWIIAGALLGGPVGMSGYVAAIRLIGPGYTAVISAMYPAFGSLLAAVFLKERLRPVSAAGLLLCIGGVIALGASPGGADGHFALSLPGLACALLCCIGWASEAVICAHGLRDPDITDEQALQIRQLTSAICYGAVLLPLLKGWSLAKTALSSSACAVILFAALFGTASYVFHYRAISRIGASRAMPLNITYSAWAMLFSALLLHNLPSPESILCCLAIIAGSLTAAQNPKEKRGKI